MESLLEIFDLRVEFSGAAKECVRALRGVDLRVLPCEAVAILGESGCGKSTVAKTVMQLLPSTAKIASGRVELTGQNLLDLAPKKVSALRGARISLIPQDAGLALSPFLKIGIQIAEVLRAHKAWNWGRYREEAEQLLSLVQLRKEGRRIFDAYPHQLSGGEQQRVAIAQAIACRPELIIADEPTASLDSETEGEILRLFRSLRESAASLLFITHRPGILRDLVDRIAVMYAGRVVEEGTTEQVLERPLHPYTRALLACGQRKHLQDSEGTTVLPTIPGNALAGSDVWRGCSFAQRCSSRIGECDRRAPARTVQAETAAVECLLYES